MSKKSKQSDHHICSKEFSEELCFELGLPLECWGALNNALCDAYAEGQQDIKKRLIGEDNPVLNGDLNSRTVKVPTVKKALEEL